jgi:hypothetical protein
LLDLCTQACKFFFSPKNRSHGNEEMNGLSEELLSEVRSEAEYYGISPLVKQLTLCCELNESSCGDVLFYAFLAPPLIPGRILRKMRDSKLECYITVSRRGL